MCKHSGELLQVHEAAQCLTDEDQRKEHAEQDKATEALQELQQYRKDYKEHRAAHVKAAGGCTKKVVEYKGPKKVNYDHLNQKTCKLLLPPGGVGVVWILGVRGTRNFLLVKRQILRMVQKLVLYYNAYVILGAGTWT